MHKRSFGNVLLVELLIVLFFFSVASTVILQVFLAAHNTSSESAAISSALLSAQDVAEMLAASPDYDQTLSDAGYGLAEGGYCREFDGYAIWVDVAAVSGSAGTKYDYRIWAARDDAELFSLDSSRYFPEVAP